MVKGISRRDLVAASGAGLVASPFLRIGPARAAEFTLRFGCVVNAQDPLVQGMMAASEKLKQQTGGRVDLQVFHSSLLGADLQMLQQVRSGAIDMMSISPLILAGAVPGAAINGIGFAFPTYADVWKTMDGPLGARVRTDIDKFGVVALSRIWNGGYRQMTTATKPIQTAADLKGLKIRVPVSPLWTSMFQAFGAAPASINWGEVYTALQTHIVDGQETPLISIEASKLYEVQKYCSMTNHMWDGYWVLVGRRTLAGLPKDVAETVTALIDAQALEQRAAVERLNTELKASLASKGLVFNDTDPTSFQAALREGSFYADWKKRFGDEAWGLLEAGIGRKLA
jgi:tripartite ATP-independent transporter DctP family solute receptor